MSSSGLSWQPLLSAWLQKKPPAEAHLLRTCFEDSFAHVHLWSSQNLRNKMDVLECNVINQVPAPFSRHLACFAGTN